MKSHDCLITTSWIHLRHIFWYLIQMTMVICASGKRMSMWALCVSFMSFLDVPVSRWPCDPSCHVGVASCGQPGTLRPRLAMRHQAHRQARYLVYIYICMYIYIQIIEYIYIQMYIYSHQRVHSSLCLSVFPYYVYGWCRRGRGIGGA